MAIGQVLRFPGVGTDKYDAVRAELGWDSGKGTPPGLLAHAVGETDDGFCVIEWWDSEDDWDTFFSSALQPAFGKIGGIPQPDVTRFTVHKSFPV
ncbi:MAG TPA: hypothetical protein VIX85_09380 [Acidimicrobiales bacterium]